MRRRPPASRGSPPKRATRRITAQYLSGDGITYVQLEWNPLSDSNSTNDHQTNNALVKEWNILENSCISTSFVCGPERLVREARRRGASRLPPEVVLSRSLTQDPVNGAGFIGGSDDDESFNGSTSTTCYR